MPLLIAVKLIIASLCGILDSIGGYCFVPARRFIMPFVLAIAVSIISRTWWLGIGVLLIIPTLCLGYKDFGKGNFSRGMWLFVQYVLCGLVMTITGHLSWYLYLPYCVLGGVLGGSLVSVWQPLGDLIEGFMLGSIIFIIHP